MTRREGSRWSGAITSNDDLYRYSLWRRWEGGNPHPLIFIMLNPSTADHEKDDQTISKCIGFATRAGYGGIEVINLYGLRATQPKHLLHHPDPEGPDNDKTWSFVLDTFCDSPVVAAWGASIPSLAPASLALACRDRSGWLCLGHTQSNNQPVHPGRIPYDSKLVPL